MSKSRSEKISKYLSRHLRHQPDAIGIKIAPGGWTSVDELLIACANHNFTITKEELREVVFTNDKKRFSFDVTEGMIRANQGHSIEVDLQLKPTRPPDILYHGTSHAALESIMQIGLVKMSRHHVHLSTNITTARKAGMRHGKPVVLEVKAKEMSEANYQFYCSENGVWLVDCVPTQYLQIVSTL